MKYLLFIYSKKERWGILSLVLLNLVLVLISFSFKRPSYEFTEASIIAFQIPNSTILQDSFPLKTQIDSLFSFNPNNASEEVFIALGFSERVTKNILNYRSKGGQFYTTQSLKKIYGMDSLFFEKIKDYCQIPKDKSFSKKPFTKRFVQAKIQSKRFAFDPNTASKTDLLSLGFPKKSANALLNYRSKGGRIYKPDALKKIYGVSASFYESIESLIDINSTQLAGNQPKKPQKPRSTFTSKSGKIRPQDKKLEINSATQEEWESLPAIGPFHAKNIVKLRQKLGGFYNIKQIKESYRLTDSTFQVIEQYLIIDKRKIQKLDLQRSRFKEINRHPYITYEHTKLLMKAQREESLYSLEDLKKTGIFNEEELEKLIPYLIFPEADYED